MKTSLVIGIVALTTVAAGAADSRSKVQAAISKLAKQPNYSWVQTLQAGAEGGATGGSSSTEGKTERLGYTLLSIKRAGSTTEAALKGEKAVVKMDDGWKTLDELSQASGAGVAQRGPTLLLVRTLRAFKLPVAEAEEVLGKLTSVTQSEGFFLGEFTEEAAKEILSRGRRPGVGGDSIQPTETKGTAKFWLKDGMIVKCEYSVQGKFKFARDGQELDRPVNRTTVVEIKDIGATRVEVPDAAKQKLN
jgi:hypothetical protein